MAVEENSSCGNVFWGTTPQRRGNITKLEAERVSCC